MPDPKNPDGTIDTGGAVTVMPSINEPPGSDVEPVSQQPQPQPSPPPGEPASKHEASADPDELEEELEDAEDEGDVEITHSKTTVKKKKK